MKIIVTKGDILKLEKVVDQSNLMKDPTLRKTFFEREIKLQQRIKKSGIIRLKSFSPSRYSLIIKM